MLDIHLEPDEEEVREVEDLDEDFDFQDEENSLLFSIAEFNYECRLYGEPEKQVPR